jgi:hypothetical protein
MVSLEEQIQIGSCPVPATTIEGKQVTEDDVPDFLKKALTKNYADVIKKSISINQQNSH